MRNLPQNGAKELELILQKSDVLGYWPLENREEISRMNDLRVSFQDARVFPTLEKDFIVLDVGFRHKVQVGATDFPNFNISLPYFLIGR